MEVDGLGCVGMSGVGWVWGLGGGDGRRVALGFWSGLGVKSVYEDDVGMTVKIHLKSIKKIIMEKRFIH